MVANYLISHIPAKNMPSNLRILTALSFAQEDSFLENPKTHAKDFSCAKFKNSHYSLICAGRFLPGKSENSREGFFRRDKNIWHFYNAPASSVGGGIGMGAYMSDND